MWFKNLQLYRLTRPFTLSAEEVHEKLAADPFRPCGSLETATQGWVPPLGRLGEQLTHFSGGFILVCARKEEKILPAAVVREEVDEKVLAIEETQMRPVRRKERESIRDEVLQDLLPRAFTRSGRTYAYIDPRGGWVVVDAGSAKKAEEVLSLLRQSLGSLPVAPPRLRMAPATVMTHWLTGEIPPGAFEIGDECELREPAKEGGVVRCKRQDLWADEVRAHLAAGKQVSRLAVRWNERIACVLGEDLAVKRLGFEDVIQEQADVDEDDIARFDTEFALMTLELSRFIPAVMEAFGGEEEDPLAASA